VRQIGKSDGSEREAWIDEAYENTRPLVNNMKTALERYYEATKDK